MKLQHWHKWGIGGKASYPPGSSIIEETDLYFPGTFLYTYTYSHSLLQTVLQPKPRWSVLESGQYWEQWSPKNNARNFETFKLVTNTNFIRLNDSKLQFGFCRISYLYYKKNWSVKMHAQWSLQSGWKKKKNRKKEKLTMKNAPCPHQS